MLRTFQDLSQNLPGAFLVLQGIPACPGSQHISPDVRDVFSVHSFLLVPPVSRCPGLLVTLSTLDAIGPSPGRLASLELEPDPWWLHPVPFPLPQLGPWECWSLEKVQMRDSQAFHVPALGSHLSSVTTTEGCVSVGFRNQWPSSPSI